MDNFRMSLKHGIILSNCGRRRSSVTPRAQCRRHGPELAVRTLREGALREDAVLDDGRVTGCVRLRDEALLPAVLVPGLANPKFPIETRNLNYFRGFFEFPSGKSALAAKLLSSVFYRDVSSSRARDPNKPARTGSRAPQRRQRSARA